MRYTALLCLVGCSGVNPTGPGPEPTELRVVPGETEGPAETSGDGSTWQIEVADGSLVVDGQSGSIDALEARLAERTPSRVVLRSTETGEMTQTMQVAELLRAHQVEDIALQVGDQTGAEDGDSDAACRRTAREESIPEGEFALSDVTVDGARTTLRYRNEGGNDGFVCERMGDVTRVRRGS